MEGFTKLKAKSEQVIGDVTQVRISVVGGPLLHTPFHVDAVTATHAAEDGESWTPGCRSADRSVSRRGAGWYQGQQGDAVRGVAGGHREGQKTGKSKMYWYSAERKKSEWKEPAKYFPVKFKKAK